MLEFRTQEGRVILRGARSWSCMPNVLMQDGDASCDILRVQEATLTRIAHLMVLQGLPLTQLFTGPLVRSDSDVVHTGPFLLVRGQLTKPGVAPVRLHDFVLLHVASKTAEVTLSGLLGEALGIVGLQNT